MQYSVEQYRIMRRYCSLCSVTLHATLLYYAMLRYIMFWLHHVTACFYQIYVLRHLIIEPLQYLALFTCTGAILSMPSALISYCTWLYCLTFCGTMRYHFCDVLVYSVFLCSRLFYSISFCAILLYSIVCSL